jgi:hypothetical protein
LLKEIDAFSHHLHVQAARAAMTAEIHECQIDRQFVNGK